MSNMTPPPGGNPPTGGPPPTPPGANPPPGGPSGVVPPGAPPPGAPHLPPPGVPAGAHNVPDSGDRQGRGWKIATGVLAVTTVLAFIWGFNTNRNYNDLKASTDAQMAQMQQQLAAVQANAGKQHTINEQKMKALTAKFDEVKGNLNIDSKDLKSEDRQLKQLRSQYERTKAAAAQDDATLKDQLAASQATANLAKHCAAVLSSGLLRIYEDVPTVVTYRKVANQLTAASVQCKGVVEVASPSQ